MRRARVLAVAAHIERDHVEIGEKAAPELKIPVDAEPISMADEEPRAGNIAVPARLQHRAIGTGNGEDGVRLRNLKRRQPDLPG